MKRRGPTKLSALLEHALARIGLDRRLDDYRVWQAWDEVVGRTISRNAQPVRLDGTRLIITVRSSTWLQELSLLQRELIARINEWMQRDVVHELFFVVGRVEHSGPGSAASSGNRPASLGEPQGQRQGQSQGQRQGQRQAQRQTQRVATAQDAANGSDAVPPTDDLGPEAAATFERLWRAARARRDV